MARTCSSSCGRSAACSVGSTRAAAICLPRVGTEPVIAQGPRSHVDTGPRVRSRVRWAVHVHRYVARAAEAEIDGAVRRPFPYIPGHAYSHRAFWYRPRMMRKNHRFTLAARPVGLPKPTDFAFEEQD